jgi:hypothetical protein
VDLNMVLQSIDVSTAKAFVTAARNVVDAMLIEGQRVKQASGPVARDYTNASFGAEAPAGGWISDDEIAATVQSMAEAIAAEKWTQGLVFAVQALSALGAL